MQAHFGLELLRPEWERSVVCLGTFDGVHLGHQAVLREAVERAEERSVPAIPVTFDRHPAAVLAPDRCPPAVAGLAENLRRIEAVGAAVTVVLPFDRELSETPAERFLAETLVGRLRAEHLVVGHDFAFGRGREGTGAWLSSRISTSVVPAYEVDGARVSSRAIRSAVGEGQVEVAGKLLGRPFAMEGVVVGGQRLGRTLGYPTANLGRSSEGLVPGHGIYSGAAETPFGRFAAAISVGVRPTVGGTYRTVEAYLLNYPGRSLYGKALRLEFHRRIREERTFGSLEALIEQMGRDVAEVASDWEMRHR